MTRDELNEIIARHNELSPAEDDGDPAIVLTCVERGDHNRVIHPDSLGPERAKRFKERCQSIAAAKTDRGRLLKFITEEFDLESFWSPDTKSEPTEVLT